MDINLEKVIDIIFENPIKSPNSYIISFPDYSLKEIFEALLSIFTEGMQRFYRNVDGKVELKNISEKQIEKINRYFHSFGITLVIEVYTELEYLFINIIKYSDYPINNQTMLKELKLPFKSDNIIYIIGFDFVK